MIQKLKEIQCDICLNWYDKKRIKNKFCQLCDENIRSMPPTMPLKTKIDYLKNVKQNRKPNEYSSLSKKDKATFFMCSKCEWLREIDYSKLKIYCSRPICQKRSD